MKIWCLFQPRCNYALLRVIQFKTCVFQCFDTIDGGDRKGIEPVKVLPPEQFAKVHHPGVTLYKWAGNHVCVSLYLKCQHYRFVSEWDFSTLFFITDSIYVGSAVDFTWYSSNSGGCGEMA